MWFASRKFGATGLELGSPKTVNPTVDGGNLAPPSVSESLGIAMFESTLSYFLHPRSSAPASAVTFSETSLQVQKLNTDFPRSFPRTQHPEFLLQRASMHPESPHALHYECLVQPGHALGSKILNNLPILNPKP